MVLLWEHMSYNGGKEWSGLLSQDHLMFWIVSYMAGRKNTPHVYFGSG